MGRPVILARDLPALNRHSNRKEKTDSPPSEIFRGFLPLAFFHVNLYSFQLTWRCYF